MRASGQDGLGANALQRGGNILRIVLSILQRGCILVGRIADDERNALLGVASP
jgi:hypothetical protein